MQDVAGNDPQADRRNEHYLSVVPNLMSLIEHMQATMKMLDTAIAGETPVGDPWVDDNVIVLDDVTPCYVKANAALYACKAGLGVAVHGLLAAGIPENADGGK